MVFQWEVVVLELSIELMRINTTPKDAAAIPILANVLIEEAPPVPAAPAAGTGVAPSAVLDPAPFSWAILTD